MPTKASWLPGLLLGLAVIGAVSALAAVDAVTGAQALGVIGFVAGGGTGVVAAHVGGNVANQAASSSLPAVSVSAPVVPAAPVTGSAPSPGPGQPPAS